MCYDASGMRNTQEINEYLMNRKFMIVVMDINLNIYGIVELNQL